MSVVCDAPVPSSEPASGPQRSHPVGLLNGKVEREKRKRSRVTPEQLVHLERFFSMDRSPTAARRKEISDMLGMQERQTQIWFQNRRAKAKLQDGKKSRGTETPPETPPELVTGYEADLHTLLHEDELLLAAVTIIPCTDLSVGTWRRIATSSTKHDLVAYLCDTKRCLTWFIYASGHGFKMEIPFDIVVTTKFTNAAPGLGLASFILSQPPTFYLESPALPNPGRGSGSSRHWKKCADWTEDQQATKVLRHNLVGSAVQLAHVLRHLNANTSGSDVQLHSPRYHPHEPPPSILEIQPPPLAAFANPGYHHPPRDRAGGRQSDHPILTNKPPLSSPASSQHLPLYDEFATTRPPSRVILEPEQSMYPQYPHHPATEANRSTTYSNYLETSLPHHILQSSLPMDSGSSGSYSPHGSHHRSYSSGSVHSLPYESDSRMLSFSDNLQPSGGDAPTPFETPTPPLLTTPFYPAGSVPNTCTVGPYDFVGPVIPGVPNSDNIS